MQVETLLHKQKASRVAAMTKRAISVLDIAVEASQATYEGTHDRSYLATAREKVEYVLSELLPDILAELDKPAS